MGSGETLDLTAMRTFENWDNAEPMTAETPYLVRLGELQEDAAKLLLHSLPEAGWTSCSLDYREAGPVSEVWVVVTDDRGDVRPVKPAPALIADLKNLRGFMATRGSVWLSATLQLAEGRYAFDFNYRQRPLWQVAVTDDAYIADLSKYPRPADQIPDWYPRGV